MTRSGKGMCLALFMFTANTYAKDVYVTDVLQLQVRETEEESSATVTRLSSGDKVTLLNKGAKTSKIRTSEGKTGWVKSWFLIDEPPAKFLLKEAQTSIESLKHKITQLQSEVTARDEERSTQEVRLKEVRADLDQKLLMKEEALEKAEEARQATSQKLERFMFFERYNISLLALGILLAGMLIGFYGSIWLQVRRQKKRLNGFRLSL